MTSTLKLSAATLAVLLLGACEPGREADARPAIQATLEAPAQITAEAAAIRYVTAASGNAARYRIREQLVGLDLPNDAVGETSGVTGTITADAKGNVVSAESKFTVDVSTLKSDKDRRDNFVRRRILETEQYPTVTFVPKSVKGIGLPVPSKGTKTFQIIGDLTVRGATRPVTWNATAAFSPTGMKGKAVTSFTFADFGIDQPKVPVVLSVDETIKLELDFNMIAQ
jgi:polyisoprenoid-binding protein YceI